MPLSALPVELTDAIIDHLHDDRPVLATCALVCRAWRGAAQHHLLSKLFCAGGALGRLLAQLEGADRTLPAEDEKDDKENLSILGENNTGRPTVEGSRSASRAGEEKGLSESFAARIREVWVLGAPHGPTEAFDIGTMMRVLAAMPNLHTLHLVRVSLAPSDASCAYTCDVHADGLRPQPRNKYKLRRLDLPMVYQANVRRLVAMLGLCAEVRELTLKCVSPELIVWGERDEDVDGGVKDGERTRCEHLVIDGRYPVSLEVRRALRFDGLKAYEVKFPRTKNVPVVLEMLGAAAESLESLTLHLYSTSPASAWEPIREISWVALTHLSLVLEVQNGSEPLHLAPITLLLSYMPQTISDIELKLDESWWTIKALRALGWDTLETQLLRLTRLRSFTVRLYPARPGFGGYFMKTAKKAMPTLAARGILLEAGQLPAQIAQS